MLILTAHIVHQDGPGMVKEQHTAEHVIPAGIPDQIRTGIRIPCGDSKVMIRVTRVLGDVGARPGE